MIATSLNPVLRSIVVAVVVVAGGGVGCIADLDSFVWNPRNCKNCDK